MTHECLICLEMINEDKCYILDCCGEKYCAPCLESWRNHCSEPTCPKCRSYFDDAAMPPVVPVVSTHIPLNLPENFDETRIRIGNDGTYIFDDMFIARPSPDGRLLHLTSTDDPQYNSIVMLEDMIETTPYASNNDIEIEFQEQRLLQLRRHVLPRNILMATLTFLLIWYIFSSTP